jgi:putative MFS transporter
MESATRREPEDSYLRRLLALLVPAAFFHGFDITILAVLLPEIADQFAASEAVLGLTRIPIELGLFVAFFVARLTDRYGRRSLLLWTILGYTLTSALTALSWDLTSFVVFQFLSRVMLGAEIIVAVTVVVEEFPAQRRARALGILFLFEALGTIAVAALLTLGLAETALGWRAFYLAGLPMLIPLVLLRRGIRETARFTAQGPVVPPTFLSAWRRGGRRLLAVGGIHLFRSIPLFGATAWWAFYAERERGFTDTEVGLYLLFGYGLGCLGYPLCARLLTRVGYRPTAIGFLLGAAVACAVLFQTTDRTLMFFALIFAVGLGLGCEPALSGFAAELFPTAVRGQATAWVRSWFALPGIVLGPALVGLIGDPTTGIGSIGDAVTWLTLLLIPAALLIWLAVPEPAGRQLEDLAPA